jgi:hypothetical protein
MAVDNNFLQDTKKFRFPEFFREPVKNFTSKGGFALPCLLGIYS